VLSAVNCLNLKIKYHSFVSSDEGLFEDLGFIKEKAALKCGLLY
jgi:hypothetical protein